MNKVKNYERVILVFTIICIFLAPEITQFIIFPTHDNKNKDIWFNPHLSSFFTIEDPNLTSYPFNAWNESYIVCKIQNTAYTNFTISGQIYNVSYGMNYIPIDFGEENQSYTVNFEYTDIQNDVYAWFVVEPVIIDEGFIEINPYTLTSIPFEAGGLISFLIKWNCTKINNFTYDELYVEFDGIVINEIREDWDHEFEIDPYMISYSISKGSYIQFDIFTKAGSHIIKLKGNATVDYKIVVSGDWDEDYISNIEEIQEAEENDLYDIFVPAIWGSFQKGSAYRLIEDPENEYGIFSFFIPESYSETQFFQIKLISGVITNVTIDDNDLRFKGSTFLSPNTLYYGKIGTGDHSVYYRYPESCLIAVLFYINGSVISIINSDGIGDTDCDFLIDKREKVSGTDPSYRDSDFDFLPDGVDSSPTSYLEINNTKEITEFVFPNNQSRETLVRFSIKKFDNDYTTRNGTKIWNDMRISIFPMMRIFGNSSISKTDLENTYEKEVKSYDITGTNPIYGDGFPKNEYSIEDYILIAPEISDESFSYALIYDIENSAKSDSYIILRFDFVWSVISIEGNNSKIIHLYNIDETVILQYISIIETDKVYYILGSPDSMIESEILWNLNQNPNLGSFSDFGVSNDVVGFGEANHSEVFSILEEIRENDPIEVDINGNFMESEVIYFSYLFSQYDILLNITQFFQWTSLSETQRKTCKYETFVSSFISTTSFSENSEEQNRQSDSKICYIKEFGNYSKSYGSLEERYEILEYPIYMNNFSFQEANILEVTNIDGSGIPLNSLPSSIESEIHDKSSFLNSTIIESKEYNQEQLVEEILIFNNKYDIEKTLYDSRLLNIPLSDIIFNEYSISFIDDLIKYFDELIRIFQEPSYIIGDLIYSLLMPQNSHFTLVAGLMGIGYFLSKPIVPTLYVSLITLWNEMKETISYLTDFSFDESYDYVYTLREIYQIPIQDIGELDIFVDQVIPVSLSIEDAFEVVFLERLSGRRTFFELTNQFLDDDIVRILRDMGFTLPSRVSNVARISEQFDQYLQASNFIAEYKNSLKFLQKITDITDIYRKHQILRTFLQELAEFNNLQLNGYATLLRRILRNVEGSRERLIAFGFEPDTLDRVINVLEDRGARLSGARDLIDDIRLRINNARIECIEDMSSYVEGGLIRLIAYLPTERKQILKTLKSPIIAISFSILFIYSAYVDFEIGEKALSERDYSEYNFRQLVGITKYIIGMALLISIVPITLTTVFRLAYPNLKSPSVIKFLVVSHMIFKYVGVIVQLFGIVLDLIYLEYYLEKIQTCPYLSNSFQKNFISIILIILTITEIVISFYMISSVILGFAVASWIPYLGFVVAVMGLLITLAIFPNESKTAGVVPKESKLSFFINSFKKNGGFNIGDQVGFYINITSTGTATTYVQSRIKFGDSNYSDWDGNWSSGYTQGESDIINPNQTLVITESALSGMIEVEIAVDGETSKEIIYSEETPIIIPISVLDSNISDFYDDLLEDPDQENRKSYSELISKLNLYNNSFFFYKKSELSEKLSNRIAWDFFNDVPGTSVDYWYSVKENENKFTTLLRPDTLIYNYNWYLTGAPSMPEAIDDLVLYPILYVGINDYIECRWLSSYCDFGFTENSLPNAKKITNVTLYLYEYSEDPIGETDSELGIYWRSNSSANWYYDSFIGEDEVGQWHIFEWSNITCLDDLNNFQIRICEEQFGLKSFCRVYSVYAIIEYEPNDILGNTPIISSEYNGHNNIVNVSCYGEHSEVSFYKPLSPSKTSGIIDFWVCKDNYTLVKVNKFFTIDRFGSILNYYNKTEYLRERPILIDEWNHFSINFATDKFDLYINGIQCVDDFMFDDPISLSSINFTMLNDFDPMDCSKTNITKIYIDSIDYSWDSNWYQWRSFAWDYSLDNISYYEDYYNDLPIHTTISTDFRKSVVQMDTDTNIAEFVFNFKLEGTDYPNVDIALLNIPSGFTVNTSLIEQNITDTVNFKITDTGILEYAGIYYFNMNVTLDSDGTCIYFEKVPFIIPTIKDYNITQPSLLFEKLNVDGNYTATYDFLNDTIGGDPSYWDIWENGGTVNIISSLDGHNNILELNDTKPNTVQAEVWFTDQNNGVVEFWFQTSDSYKRTYIFFHGSHYSIFIDIKNGLYHYGSTSTIPCENNTWYHHNINFDCSIDRFYWYIDSVLVAENVSFYQSGSYIDHFIIYTETNQKDYCSYIDAIGFSGDSEYIIGDNLYPTVESLKLSSSVQISKGDMIYLDYATNSLNSLEIIFENNDVIQNRYQISPSGFQNEFITPSSIMINETFTFDEICIESDDNRWFKLSKIFGISTTDSVGVQFNPVNITNNGNYPLFFNFYISGIETDNKTVQIRVFPSETIDVIFNLETPSESFDNLYRREIDYSLCGTNIYGTYIDNLEMDGIYIDSINNNSFYIVYGDEGDPQLDLYFISEETTLDWCGYSIDGNENMTIAGNTKIPFPETDGNHTIQVFGNNSIGTMFSSELITFDIKYPINIIYPNTTENTIDHELTRESDSFTLDETGSNPEDWTVVESDLGNLFISSASMVHGSKSGTISDTYTDDSNYYMFTSEWVSGASQHTIEATLSFTPICPSGRDYYFSYHIESNETEIEAHILINGDNWKEGTILDDDEVFKSGVNTVKIYGADDEFAFNIKVYFFKMELDQDIGVEVIQSMNGIHQPVEISNGGYNSEFSIEKEFSTEYILGNVSFSILRESISTYDTVVITLNGSGGTMVYTLEYNDLYNGSYASKSLLKSDILKSDKWQNFVIFFNVSEGCQIFVDDMNTTNYGIYSPFSTGSPTNITGIKIEAIYHSGNNYRFWFDDFALNEIHSGFMLQTSSSFTNLQYSFDGNEKKSFENYEVFSFPTSGEHSIVFYGTDVYGYEYQSENRTFTTSTSYDIYPSKMFNATPSQWSGFTFINGSGYSIGDLEFNNGNYSVIKPGYFVDGGTDTEIIRPNSDVSAGGWSLTPLCDKIDDNVVQPTAGDSVYIYKGSSGTCTIDCNSFTLPYGSKATKITIWTYGKSGTYDSYSVAYQIGTGTVSSFKSPSQDPGSWKWGSKSWTGLELDQDDVDDLRVLIKNTSYGSGTTKIDVAYMVITYQTMDYIFDYNVTLDLAEENITDFGFLYYDYQITEAIDFDLDIYNWDTQSWTQLESNSISSYITDSYNITDAYVNDENKVRIRFQSESTNNSNIVVKTDQLMIAYTTNPKKEL